VSDRHNFLNAAADSVNRRHSQDEEYQERERQRIAAMVAEQKRRALLEHQTALMEQLAICAEVQDIQVRFHSVIDALVDRKFLRRDEVRKLIAKVDPSLTSLAFELQKFVAVNGNIYPAPHLDVESTE
jgi:hypothetical protein